MKIKRYGLELEYIHPGEIHLTDKPKIFRTVLGSCVSVIMYSKKDNIHAMSHSMIPHCRSDNLNCENCDVNLNATNCSIISMYNYFERLKIKNSDISIKVFGGGIITDRARELDKAKTISSMNVASAKKTLAELKLKISAESTGGYLGRKLLYFTDTCEVYQAYLKQSIVIAQKRNH